MNIKGLFIIFGAIFSLSAAEEKSLSFQELTPGGIVGGVSPVDIDILNNLFSYDEAYFRYIRLQWSSFRGDVWSLARLLVKPEPDLSRPVEADWDRIDEQLRKKLAQAFRYPFSLDNSTIQLLFTNIARPAYDDRRCRLVGLQDFYGTTDLSELSSDTPPSSDESFTPGTSPDETPPSAQG